ncbi:hypothetical protein RSSM_03690 [Rhodopirellula sallentina SM41]|uniref:Uncharacterized protein n=1 Tax=Rhodopirellula sallentina SM41 TaxID=1263870 RepID=M5U073_9BACT|nr:hypothetical protein RSSM_03690 [Rhodopirellula sallentina SM41]
MVLGHIPMFVPGEILTIAPTVIVYQLATADIRTCLRRSSKTRWSLPDDRSAGSICSGWTFW